MSKKILIFAGPNGAGKTTFARAFLPGEAVCPRFFNADLIAAGLSPFAPDAAAVRAGKLMLAEIDHAVARGDSFALETTLSGRGYLRHLTPWRERGYRVTLLFLRLPDAPTAVARVASRVRQGGHDIPEPVIRRRFDAGLRNLERYQAGVDGWAVFDNAGPEPVLIDWGESPGNAGDNAVGTSRDVAGAGVDLAEASDPDLRASLAALRRAATLAREQAIRTDTEIVIVRDGERVTLSAETLRGQAEMHRGQTEAGRSAGGQEDEHSTEQTDARTGRGGNDVRRSFRSAGSGRCGDLRRSRV